MRVLSAKFRDETPVAGMGYRLGFRETDGVDARLIGEFVVYVSGGKTVRVPLSNVCYLITEEDNG